MATYVKLPYCTSDYVLGYQTINQGRDNLEAVNDGVVAEHFVDTQSASARHDIEAIPRDSVFIYGTSTTSNQFFPTNIVEMETGTYAVRAFRPPSVAGTYFVVVVGLSEFYGEVIASCASGTPKPLIVCRPDTTNTYGAGNGLLITCYEMGSGSMVLTDFDLTVTVYGTVA